MGGVLSRFERYVRAAGAGAIVGVLPATACGPGPEERVEEFVRAHNFGQPALALAGLTTDVTVRMPGADLRNTLAVAEWLRWDSVVGSRLSLEGVESRGDTVTVTRLREANEWLALLGIGELLHEPGGRFVLRGRAIASIDVGPLEKGSRDALDRTMAGFLPWTLHEYPDRLRRIRPNGEFAYGARRAADWLSLVRQWRRRSPPP